MASGRSEATERSRSRPEKSLHVVAQSIKLDKVVKINRIEREPTCISQPLSPFHHHVAPMHASIVLPALTAFLPLASAGFSNTHALLAWSDSAASNLESFRPFSAKASQAYALQQASSAGEECYPALVVSAPSFKHDDLELLDAGSTIRREWTSSAANLHVPYVASGSVEPLKSLVARRLGHCDTPVLFRKMKDHAKGLGSTRAAWVNELGRC